MFAALGDEASVLSRAQKRVAEYRMERVSLEYNPLFGHPATRTAEENFDRINHMVTDGMRLTTNQIVDIISRSRGTVVYIQ